jgi:hypothetical protein
VPIRTTPGSVQAILLSDYDGESALDIFIRGANSIVDRLVTCAADEGYTFTTAEKELLEAYVAAYRYSLSDRLYSSRNTSKAGGSFLMPEGNQNPYFRAAIELDPSGCLRELLTPAPKAEGFWLGKAPSEQTDYTDRD